MDKERCLKLAMALYGVSRDFPAGEPLRQQIREKANSILESFLFLACAGQGIFLIQKKEIAFQMAAGCEVLIALLELAKKQNWAARENLDVLQAEYRKIAVFAKEKLAETENAKQPDA
ncbi:MAG: hypothetical protein M1127_03350, partial [Patescibacteria group bacterium]|nr:hypothetical protein [Patescibacteria group bacterium]